MIYLYARVSTDKQENGREAQVQRLLDWAEGKDYVLFVDEDVSARSVRLNRRKAGKAMCDALKPGDIVVITKDDRAFRSSYDLAVTRQQWRQMGIHLEIMDLPEAFKTPEGELFLTLKVAFGQYESELHGQRKREVYAHKKRTGQPYATTRPFGWVVVKGRHGREWKECQYERDTAAMVKELRDAGKSWGQISAELCYRGRRKPPGSRNEFYYDSDLCLLVKALEAGFPKRSQASWRERGSAPKQPAG